jgi:hypothetical protein
MSNPKLWLRPITVALGSSLLAWFLSIGPVEAREEIITKAQCEKAGLKWKYKPDLSGYCPGWPGPPKQKPIKGVPRGSRN